jgi:hypothetical protein
MMVDSAHSTAADLKAQLGELQMEVMDARRAADEAETALSKMQEEGGAEAASLRAEVSTQGFLWGFLCAAGGSAGCPDIVSVPGDVCMNVVAQLTCICVAEGGGMLTSRCRCFAWCML